MNAIKINRPGASRGPTGESQPFAARERVDQAGLSDIASSQEGNLRKAFAGKGFRLGRAYNELGFQNHRSLTVAAQQHS